jgi:glyoxylase-like metal-dependent hydrolase (beta-lactamase superfamily II)
MSSADGPRLLFRQLYDPTSSTYTYMLADATTKEGVLIDPVLEQVDRDLALVKELGVKLLAAIDTHCHADHVTGAATIKASANQPPNLLDRKTATYENHLTQSVLHCVPACWLTVRCAAVGSTSLSHH